MHVLVQDIIVKFQLLDVFVVRNIVQVTLTFEVWVNDHSNTTVTIQSIQRVVVLRNSSLKVAVVVEFYVVIMYT